MTKNITAVLFALLLSTAAFAQYWGPGHFQHTPSPAPGHSQANDVMLNESNAIARVFAGYRSDPALPTKAKTRAKLNYFVNSISPMDNMGQVPPPMLIKEELPAVFVAAKNSEDSYFLALPAQALKNIPSDVLELSYSLTLINNGKLMTKEQRFAVKEGGCPTGMTLRRAANSNEADICLLQQSVKTSYRKGEFIKLFKEKRVTLEMAARALKRK